MVNDANVVIADVPTGNGVHIGDSVILPTLPTAVEAASWASVKQHRQ